MDRDLLKEQKAFQSLQLKLGRDPNASEVQQIYSSIYGSQLPPELAQTQQATAGTAQTLNQNMPNASKPGATLPYLQNQLGQATARTQQFNSPNSAINVLQEAIRTKSGSANLPLGESETFKAAGIGGWGALQASLSARGQELDNNYYTYQNKVNSMIGTYKDLANKALENYKISSDMYKDEVARLDKYNQDAEDRKQALDILDYKQKLDEAAANNKFLRDSGQWNYDANQPIQEREGGSVSWRNNNPGNIKFGPFAEQYGATKGAAASDGGNWAVFPDEQTGIQAQKDLLTSPNYKDLSLDQALLRWSGNGYDSKSLIKTIGYTPSWQGKKTSQMSDAELNDLVEAMRKREGWKVGKTNDKASQNNYSWSDLDIMINTLTNALGNGEVEWDSLPEELKGVISRERTGKLDDLTGEMAYKYSSALSDPSLKSAAKGKMISEGFKKLEDGSKETTSIKRIKVKVKSSGATGTIPENEFDASIYEKL